MDRIAKYDAFDVPVGSIYYDGSFNCRGEFTPQSVFELSESIKLRGLDFPLVVQPAGDVEGGLPAYKQYRLICGHRRFKSITTFLGWTRIPCTMRAGLTDREARMLNLTENLERHDLNPLEEAIAIGRLFPERMTLAVMAAELKRSTAWVKYRLDILTLPEEIQKQVAARMLTMNDVRVIACLPLELRAEAAKVMLRVGREGVTRPKRGSPRKKRRSQINKMIERLFDGGLTGLSMRLLAWAVGGITDEEIEVDIRAEILRSRGEKIVLPADVNDCRIIWNPSFNPARPLGSAPEGGRSTAGENQS